MKHLAAALMFIACIGWIAASILIHGHGGKDLASWDFLAAVGALIAFFQAVGD